MSVYDKVSANRQYYYPSKKDFTKYFVTDLENETVSVFDNEEDAINAVPKSIKKSGNLPIFKKFDDEAYRKAITLYTNENKEIDKRWSDSLRSEYPDVNEKVFGLCLDYAWEHSHSNGYREVENKLDDMIDFAKSIIDGAKNA